MGDVPEMGRNNICYRGTEKNQFTTERTERTEKKLDKGSGAKIDKERVFG